MADSNYVEANERAMRNAGQIESLLSKESIPYRRCISRIGGYIFVLCIPDAPFMEIRCMNYEGPVGLICQEKGPEIPMYVERLIQFVKLRYFQKGVMRL